MEAEATKAGFHRTGKPLFMVATVGMDDEAIVKYQQDYIDWLKGRGCYDQHASVQEMQVGFGVWLLQQHWIERSHRMIVEAAEALESEIIERGVANPEDDETLSKLKAF